MFKVFRGVSTNPKKKLIFGFTGHNSLIVTRLPLMIWRKNVKQRRQSEGNFEVKLGIVIIENILLDAAVADIYMRWLN